MKNASVFLVMSVLTLSVLQNAYGFSGQGSGTEQDPYIITDVYQLQEMNNDLDAWYKLGNNIDASDTINWNSGEGFIPVGNDTDRFIGNFDGNNFTITDLFINRSSSDYQGLFGKISNAEVSNVNLINVNISGYHYVGGLVGYIENSTINNSYSIGNVTGIINVGGLVGYLNFGNITNSYTIGNINGTMNVGGLVGRVIYEGYIENSYATGNINGGTNVGGLIGENYVGVGNYYGIINNSYATGNVNGSRDYVGGLVGRNRGTISNSYATGNVNGSRDYVGGLAGYDILGTILNSYATGNVNGINNSVGGLIGREDNGIVSNSYATGNVNGYNRYVGGLIGYCAGDISNSYATGDVNGTGSSIGGLAGAATRTTLNSYANGNVNGIVHVGGLIGNNGGTILNSYATGNVTGSISINVGGLAGYNMGGSGIILNSYWDIQTSGINESWGGEGKTTAELKTKSTFTDAGWDFLNIWTICEEIDYPRLLWQGVTCPADLEVTSEDITFAPVPGEPCSPVTISATIWNFGSTSAENIVVAFKDFDTVIGSQVITSISPGDSNTVSIQHTWPEASFRLITVIVDPNNVIAELDENNNSASKVYQVGDVPEMGASIEITCSAPTGFPQGATATISGQAIYNILIEGQPNYEYPVKGGSVSAQIIDCNGIQQELIELYTDTDGRFNVSFEVPCLAGDKFDVVITVTDDTLTETLRRSFDVIEWRDFYVYSSDITFSNNNPADGETITIGATVHADILNTYTDYNIPVTFSVYPPTGGSYQIGDTNIITQMAPGDSNTVSVTWTNTGEGEYYIEVSLEPNFSDDRNLNNRAIIRLTVGPPSPTPPPPPPTEPVKFDLWVYSEDVNFSDINPDLGESITIDALLHAASDNTRTEPNVPVTFYAHHPTGETYQIGRTIMIEQMYPGDNHLVSTTWRNAAEGAYIIEAVLGPGYLDDNNGNNQATRELTVGNRAPAANAGQDQTVECACSTEQGTQVTLNGTGSSDPDGDPLTYIWTGPFIESPATGPTPIVTLSDGCPGNYVITLVVNDGKVNSLPDDVVITVEDATPPSITCPADVTLECPADTSVAANGSAMGNDTCGDVTITHSDVWVPACGNTGTLTRTWTATDEYGNSSSCVQTITVVDTTAPVISNVDADYLLAAVGKTVNFSANVSDECDSGVDIVWNFGDGTPVSSNPGHIYGQAGIYNVTVTATDDCGNQTTDSIIIVVYDPSAGFTTGGGWFVPDAASFIDGVGVTDTVSKANFGFIVKYKMGANNPGGNLEFQYKAGDINLRSTDMEWLVVQSATKVRFKGRATINGEGLYTFKVTAEDNGEPGTGDWFKIEIWLGPNVDTENSPPTPKHKAQGFLGGGNIQIHQK